MTAAVAPANISYPSEQDGQGGANVAPSAYLTQRTAHRRRVMPNIDCIHLDQPTIWDVSMPSEFGDSSSDGDSEAARKAPHKPKKAKKPLKFINKTTNSWVSTNTTTTVVLPGATVQFVRPLPPPRGGGGPVPRGLGDSPYEDVGSNPAPQGYVAYAPQSRAVPLMGPPSAGMAPPPPLPPGAHGGRPFSYMEAYGPVLHRPVPVPMASYYPGSSRVEVLEEDSIPPQHMPNSGAAAGTPKLSENRRNSLPIIAHSADRLSGSGVPSAKARPASYDGVPRGPLPPRPADAVSASQPSSQAGGARLNGSQPMPRQNNNYTSPVSDRIAVGSVSQRTQDEQSSSAHHPLSDSSGNPRGPLASASAHDEREVLSGPRYYAELDRKNVYSEGGAESDGKGVEDLMFADEL